QTFRTVFAQVPESAKNVSDAIALIQQRTDLTGPALEELSTKMLNLAHISGEQVKPLTEQVTRAFADAGIAVKDQSKAMDEMLRASQATGMGLSQMLERVVQFGAPMRELGFSFEDSLAIMGKFQKEGVNLTTVMSGLRQAIGNFAKAGLEPAEAFQQV